MALIPNIPGVLVRPVENPVEMLAVRRLHADCYLATGYVTSEDLDSEGLIDDRGFRSATTTWPSMRRVPDRSLGLAE